MATEELRWGDWVEYLGSREDTEDADDDIRPGMRGEVMNLHAGYVYAIWEDVGAGGVPVRCVRRVAGPTSDA